MAAEPEPPITLAQPEPPVAIADEPPLSAVPAEPTPAETTPAEPTPAEPTPAEPTTASFTQADRARRVPQWRGFAQPRVAWAIGAAAALVVVILVVVLLVASAPAKHPPRAGHSAAAAAAASSAAASAPQPSSAGTAAPTPASPPAAAGPGPAPAGFHTYQDPTGFSIAVPNGWVVSHQGVDVYVSPPSGAAFLLIDQTSHPKPDPLADWQQQEANRIGTYPGYHRIRLEAISYPQAEKAADWEFTYDRQGVPTHVLNRNVLANATHAYALYWSTPQRQWAQSLHIFDVFARTFAPAR
jgi:hypothetical protein